MVVPKVNSAEEAPVILVKISQSLNIQSLSVMPVAKISFGPLGGWNESFSGFNILDDRKESIFHCGTRNSSALYLKGKLKKAVAPGIAGFFANDKAIDFKIYDLELDLTKAQIDNLHIFSQIGFDFGKVRKTFGCFKNDLVNDRFENEANKQIKVELEAIQSQINVDGLINLLLSKIEAN
jgi:hypothetical protein